MSPVGGEGTGEQSALMGDRVKTTGRVDELEMSVGTAPYDVYCSVMFLHLVADGFSCWPPGLLT